MENIIKAVSLARWLIEEKGRRKTSAYIIAARKFDVLNWHDVQKQYNAHLPKQQSLL